MPSPLPNQPAAVALLRTTAPEQPALEKVSAMIERTMYAASGDETRYNLNGVYFEVVPDAGKIRMVAPTVDPATRNVFDLSAIPVVHRLSHLPIIADPSHGTGLSESVPSASGAAMGAGRSSSRATASASRWM